MTTSVSAMSGAGRSLPRPRQHYKIMDDLKFVQKRRAQNTTQISRLMELVVKDTREIDRLLAELGEEMDWASLQGQMD